MYFKNNTGWHSTAFRLFESLTFTEYHNQSLNKANSDIRPERLGINQKLDTTHHNSEIHI